MFEKINLTFLASLLGYGAMFFFFHACTPELTAEVILQKSIAAHGGLEKSGKVKKVVYLKTTQLYDSLGNVTRTINQQLTHAWKPSFTLMEWQERETSFKAQLIGKKLTVSKNGILATTN